MNQLQARWPRSQFEEQQHQEAKPVYLGPTAGLQWPPRRGAQAAQIVGLGAESPRRPRQRGTVGEKGGSPWVLDQGHRGV